MHVAVLGGNGKTGRAVGAALARAGATAHPLGRAAFGDLPAALAGADAVHVIAPNLHPDEPAYVATVLDAAVAAGVDRVVHHSVASPYAPAMPHHLGKAVAEDLVRRSGLRWTVLQPCAYVQNFVPALRSGGDLEVPYAVDTPFGLVDLHDVAEATAAVLTTDGHAGATYELGGPALVSVADVAAAAADVLGRPVAARRTDPEAWRGEGLDAREQEWLRAMFAYYDRHGLPTGPLPLAALLGREGRAPTSLRAALARDLAGTS
ncbi:NmrA family NAD(P)-binding protein [Nocardioides sp. NPDC092400]|uniref:SDR family oxidoreductase n=1 Tax=Nocardioides sp. NPDC092400 TaxID=3155196 RepID=UPI00341D3951